MAPMDPNAPESGDCPRADTLLVAITLPKAELAETLGKCAVVAGCRAYRSTDMSVNRWVLEGVGEALGQLRNLLLPIQGLQLVREEIEAALGEPTRQLHHPGLVALAHAQKARAEAR